ncbi:MAG TPA: prepilin-type N-terminal cleavage/methylation domain-containing protein [Bryobacteraceae bacterium]|nr:prepilin-type N-terminal cleavage/methylation domain-containing protein [Bryobacteraceae bacterium]
MLQDRRRAHRRASGFSLIELLIVIAIILVIAAIAVPKLNTARMHSQEMAAIRQINTIHTAQTQYFSQFGKFAENLQQLGPPAGGTAGPAAADLISGDLAKGIKTGYQFTVAPTKEGYQVTAIPQAFNSTGRRTFFSDQSLVVRENWGADPPTATSPEIK